MKKLLLVLALTCVILSGCGSNNTQTDTTKSATNSSQNSSTSEVSSENNSEIENSQPVVPTFGKTAQSFIDVMRPYAQEQDANLFTQEPKVSEMEAGEYLPEITVYDYAVGNAGSLILYEVKSTGEFYQALLAFDISKEDETSILSLGRVSGLMMAMLEPDENTRMIIDEDLKTSNISEDATTYATGTIASWVYNVNSGQTYLTAIAS